jgi:GMP synthase (glutamine-hydrolysing)
VIIVSGMKFMIVQHDAISPPGLLGERILARGAGYDIYRPIQRYASHSPAETVALPESDDGYAGLAILGGPMDAFDDAGYPHFQKLFALIHVFKRQEKPVIGLCLGGQLIARAHGASVGRMAEKELGFVELAPTPAAADDPLFRDIPVKPRLMEWHQDRFELPEGAVELLAGTACPHQVFRMGGKTYGFQPHPEASFETIRHWIFEGRNILLPEQHRILTRMERELTLHHRETAALGITLFDRWLDLAG